MTSTDDSPILVTGAAGDLGAIDRHLTAMLLAKEHVSIVIHNYRWRLGLAEGESKYDEFEKRLAAAPVISVPTINNEGDANSAPHSDASSYAKKFSGKYSHRTIKGGIGHNLPQEAPREFAKAVVEVDGY